VCRITTGDKRVDLKKALAILRGHHNIRTVRVDSGGTLNAALLRSGFVDELSLLVHPVIAGTSAHPLFAEAKPLKGSFKLFRQERLPGGLVWLRLRVVAGKRS
jgi:2,5-diamino-6-(ribosylamino)-4(3H)-pyrimidinone 5'-phosphate reductase